jgi:putative ABC transport system substrate-binding protein
MTQVGRRRFLMGAGALAAMRLVQAQKSDRPVVLGMLSSHPRPSHEHWRNNNYASRLRELGWVEGGNLVVEHAWAGGSAERLTSLAAELVAKRVDVILAHAPEAAVAAARATKTVPIVFWGVGSPVELELVRSLSRPEANVTGVAWNAGGEVQVAKALEFLKQIAPEHKRLASIFDPTVSDTVSGGEYAYPQFEESARKLGYEIKVFAIQREEDFDATFAAVQKWRAEALVVAAMPFTARHRKRLADFANRNHLPSVFDARLFVEVGGLVSYGPDIPASQRRAIDYVDRVLRGARPAELPVELPTKFELAVNLRTAKTLGMTIPGSVLVRADRVIE